MLLWEFFFLFVMLLTVWSFIFSLTNILNLMLNSEFLIIVFFILMLNTALYSNVNLLFGLSYLFIILGGLELALSILILIL